MGNSKGYARCNGHYTDPHGQPKRLYVRALRDDACDILRRHGELAACWQARAPTAGGSEVDKRSPYEELQKIPDHRRGQGRKHSLATVLAVYLLAMLSNMRGPVAAAEYAQALDQEELKLLGAWYNRTTGRYEPPTKSTIHRVVMATDAEALEDAATLCDGARGGSRTTGPAAGAGGRRQADTGRQWAIESKNHHRRDTTLCEDACTARSGLAPANRATCNNIVLALILHQRRWDNAAQALRYFTLRRSETFKALLAPAWGDPTALLPSPLSDLGCSQILHRATP